MRSAKLSAALTAIVIVALTVLGTIAHASAQQARVLHSFSNGNDGSYPGRGLILDASGNLYGTTYTGGAYGYGTAFELMPRAGGGWFEKVLHSFNLNGIDGQYPTDSLVFDASGNLYGTTYQGGAYSCGSQNCGTVFELMPQASGGWKEKVLYSFNYDQGKDGYFPYAGLVFDAAGNLYGMTPYGGTYCGVVYELTPHASAEWTETVLLYFNSSDGCSPFERLTVDASGNLYGTTFNGGPNGSTYGTVFELSPAAGGVWAETLLDSFNDNGGSNCCYPYSNLTFDAAGNIYGTTEGDLFLGTGGTVFELTRSAGGTWTEHTLHTFTNNGEDGYYPIGDIVFDASGNLYGTASQGGAYAFGAVFELRPTAGGRWTERVIYSFSGGEGVADPYSLTIDASGNLYGVSGGGAYGYGTVFEIKP